MSFGGAPKQKESAKERELTRIAIDKYKLTKQFMVPELRYMTELDRLGGAENKTRMMQGATTSAKAGLGNVQIDPNKGQAATIDNGLSNSMVVADAAAQVPGDAYGKKAQGYLAKIDLGQGVDRGAISGLSRQAYQEGQLAKAKALSDVADRRAIASGIGTVAGAGLAKGLDAGWFGEGLQNKYKQGDLI